MPRTTRLLLATALAAYGCGSEPLDADGTSEPAECKPPSGFAQNPEPQFVGNVTATVLDLNDAPPPGLLVQVCGLDLCISGETDASGATAVSVGNAMKLPAFKYGDGLTHGTIALLLSEPSDDVELGVVRTPALPANGSAITPGAVTSSDGALLDLAANTSVVFDRLTYITPDEQAFRAADFPPELAPEGLDPGFGFERFYSLAPNDTEFCPPASLSLPNTADIPAGTELEFYLHGLSIEERYAPYGGFAKIAEGVVSEDGTTLEMTSGGLPVLSLVGVRRKP